MRKKLLKIPKKIILSHSINKISFENDQLIIEYQKLTNFFGKKFIEIKDRSTGRRIQKQVNGGRVSIGLSELRMLNDDRAKLDVYLSTYVGGRKIKARTPIEKRVKLSRHIDEITKIKYKLTKTKKRNLTINVQKPLIEQKITVLKNIGRNLLIEGIIQDLYNHKPVIAEVILNRRDVKQSYGFFMNLLAGEMENEYLFKGIIFPEKLKQHLVKNSRWDILLQLRDIDNNVFHREIINLQNFQSFEKEEERYLLNIEDFEQNLVVIYATMGKNSLALWYTDKEQFERTYTIAKGKTIFNETCENEPLNENMIFFESFFGKNYSGNPKYVYEQMLKDPRFKNFDFVWSYTGENKKDIPGNPTIVTRESEDYYKLIAKSKYWCSNIVFPIQRKREGNIYLQTWHGTPLKKLGFDIDIEGPETLARENFYIESRNWDYLISANPYSSEIFKRAFKFEKEMLEVGYPLNDIFYRKDLKEKMEKLKEKLKLPKDKKIILYAPTWRDNEMVSSWEHSFQLKFDLDKYYEQLHSDHILLLRMHHLISDSMEIDEKYKEFVYDFSSYDDIQELYVVSDILITDYSSVFFDYANTKRPMLFYAYDYEMYKENIRGFYLNMEEDLPGPVIQNDTDLLQAILNIDQVVKDYKGRYEEFYQRFCSLEDGEAAKRVIDQVFQ